MRQFIATLIQALGVIVLSVAGFIVAVPLGLAVAGAGLLAVGVSMERG